MGEWQDYDMLPDERDDEEPPFIIDNPTIKHQTEKALLISMPPRGLFWVPKSILIEQTEFVLVIPAWFSPQYFKETFHK